MITAYHLYTGSEGHSYFQKGTLIEEITINTNKIHFKETPAGSSYDWHPAPTTQYVITLSGTLEFTTSKGDIFILKPGDVLIAMDTTGHGHKWRIIDEQPWRRAYITFDKDSDLNFKPI